MKLIPNSKFKSVLIFLLIGSASVSFFWFFNGEKSSSKNREPLVDDKTIIENKISQADTIDDNFSEKLHCPEMRYDKSFQTLNSKGLSAYETENMRNMTSFCIHIGSLSQQDVILDVGTGYGNMALQFLKRGFKNIYANDISKNNIECAQQYIQKEYPEKKDIINFLPGDINSEEIIHSLPNNLKFVSIVNAINDFSANELDTLLSTLRQKIITGGFVFFVVEPAGLPVDVLDPRPGF